MAPPRRLAGRRSAPAGVVHSGEALREHEKQEERVADQARVASIGLGWWGGRLAQAAPEAGLDLVSCFARDEGARRAFAEEHGCRPADSFDAVLEDDGVDGIMLATPHSTHAGQIIQAAKAGKHVFVEKPLTVSYPEAAAAVAAADGAGIVLQVGHNRRRQDATRRIKALVDDGSIGQIHYVEANLSNPKGQTPRVGWRSDPEESPLGGMAGLGVHMVDTMQYLAGPITAVSAMSKQLMAPSALDDVTVMIFEFADGALGQLGTSMVIPDKVFVGVWGTKAAAHSDMDGEHFRHQAVGEREWTDEPVDALDTVVDQLVEFGRCIGDGSTPETDGSVGLGVVAVVDAAKESVRTGCTVQISDITGA
jgi:predicted dehydrogenase